MLSDGTQRRRLSCRTVKRVQIVLLGRDRTHYNRVRHCAIAKSWLLYISLLRVILNELIYFFKIDKEMNTCYDKKHVLSLPNFNDNQ